MNKKYQKIFSLNIIYPPLHWSLKMDIQFYNEIVFETIELETARDAVVFSFVAQKSLTYLDLSVCEYTSNVKCVFIEEQCRKFMKPCRQLLYTLNLDLPKDLEKSLRSVTPDAHNQEHYETFYLGAILVCNCVYSRNLGSSIIKSVMSAENKMEKLRRIWNVIRFLNMNISRSEAMMLFQTLILVLYPNCIDSNFVVNFAIAFKFYFFIFYAENPEIVGFVLHHATAIRLNIWQETEWRLDPINGCILFHKPGNVGALLLHGTVLHFDYTTYLKVFGDIMEQILMRRLIRKNIPHRRFFLLLQLFYYYSFNNRSWEGLICIWRSIPDPYLSESEIFLFENLISSEQLLDMIQHYKHYIVEETDQIHDTVPRSLQHLCRVVIRSALNYNYQLPYGVYRLYLPRLLKKYLNLEF